MMNLAGVTKTTVGRYSVQEGDTPASIATKLYGDVHRATEILQENGYGWGPGDTISIPGFTGFEMVAGKGEQFTRLYKRAFATAVASGIVKEEFFKWNGRDAIDEGQTVFFVDTMRKSWGY